MSGPDTSMVQSELIQSLVAVLNVLNKDAAATQLFETHLSWVLVAGHVAYKIKKAVRFDFVDYSTLDARRYYCREEFRLNRRLAPDLYLGVVKITGTWHEPVIDGSGPALEYALRMRAFPQEALWDHRIRSGLLSRQEIDALAVNIAGFHQASDAAPADAEWGTRAMLHQIAAANLDTIGVLVADAEGRKSVDALSDWLTAEEENLHPVLQERKSQGFIRACHGDLHIRNILTENGRVQAFDCIEFNESLRWIDVMNDIAFLYMDLAFHGRGDLAAQLLNQYLSVTGDYEGVAVLRYYEVQRALTRCKVALLKSHQAGNGPVAADAEEGVRYLAFSRACIAPTSPTLVITHGYSGSGKSFFSGRVVELTGAIQLRSDVERKRIATLASSSNNTEKLYSADFSRMTYQRLQALAKRLLECGWSVMVDAAFLKKEQRRDFESLAKNLGVPFFIFHILASEEVITRRIISRQKDARDASDAGLQVFADQLKGSEPLGDDEKKHVLPVNLDVELDLVQIRNICKPVIESMR